MSFHWSLLMHIDQLVPCCWQSLCVAKFDGHYSAHLLFNSSFGRLIVSSFWTTFLTWLQGHHFLGSPIHWFAADSPSSFKLWPPQLPQGSVFGPKPFSSYTGFAVWYCLVSGFKYIYSQLYSYLKSPLRCLIGTLNLICPNGIFGFLTPRQNRSSPSIVPVNDSSFMRGAQEEAWCCPWFFSSSF